MRDTEKRFIVLFRDAGFVDDAHFSEFVQKHFKGKGLMDVLKQQVSVQSFIDLMSLQIPVPFVAGVTGAPRDHHLDKMLSAPNITNDEMVEVMAKANCSLKQLAGALAAAKLGDPAKLERYRQDGAGEYERFVADGLLTPSLLAELAESSRTAYALYNRMTLAINVLVFNKLVKWEDVAPVLDLAGDDLKNVPKLLYSKNILTPQRLMKAIGDQMAFPAAPLNDAKIDREAIAAFPENFLRRNMIIPFKKASGELSLFTSDPLNLGLFDAISILTDLYVSPTFAPQGEIIRKLRVLTDGQSAAGAASAASSAAVAPIASAGSAKPAAATASAEATERDYRLESMAASVDQRSTVALVTSLIDGAVSAGATDIHIEPEKEYVRVRYRVDGVLHKVTQFPLDMLLPVVSRVKVLANMDVTERRRPQDGHFAFKHSDRHYDFRISSLPTSQGEKIVIRVLDEARVMKGLDDLGFEPEQLEQMARLIAKPYGLILSTGPTGSGKTSTLYAALSTINDDEKNIVTIEDPVEYSLAGINQVQVERNIDLSFASGLRSILRQDPDVIMVGEIRDPETAHIAIRAALTGHLVFSTLHTNTSTGAINALTNMGIQTFPLANGLTAVLAQRLVRTVCPECKRKVKPKPGVLKELGFDPEGFSKHFMEGKGCDACYNNGYKGRKGIYEVLEMTKEVRAAITGGQAEDAIAATAFGGEGAITLIEAGRRKLIAGLTTPQEVMDAVFI